MKKVLLAVTLCLVLCGCNSKEKTLQEIIE